MKNESTTLKDIAAVLGISTTTVHRALNGKPGISDQLRLEIQNLAAKMNYQTNLAASALKRKQVRIGALLPEPLLENRYYYSALWTGIRQFIEEFGNFNAGLKEFYFPLLPDGHGDALKNLYENHLKEIDGLITLGIASNKSSYFMEKISQAGIPCVVLGSDLYKNARLCCVKAFDEMAGSLAAELFTAFLPDQFQGTILLTGNPVGESGMVDQSLNISGFEEYIQQSGLSIRLRTAYCADTAPLEELLSPSLSDKALLPYGIYASSARHTVKMCQLLEHYGLTGTVKLIGNDNFPKNLEYIKNHTLTATIDKKCSIQAYTAASILFEHLSLGHYPAQDVIQIQPDILMKSNLPTTL